MTKLSLACNKLEEEGTKAVCNAVKESKTLKELDLSGDWRGSNIGGAAGAKHVADMLGVNTSLTSVSLLRNGFDTEAAAMLLKVKEDHPKLKTLCGFTHEETELDLKGRGLGPGDAMLIAPELGVIVGPCT